MALIKNQTGFSFIELMAVVAIVGILAAIAYPSYIKTVQKSNRTDAKTELADLSQRLQRCFTTNGTYATAVGTCTIKDELISANGVVTRGKFYVVKASNVAATSYTLTATPANGSVQEKDKECASFVLDHKGKKSAKNSDNADTTDVCW
jgi:type IV pilus assembly protein PilE